MLKFARMFLLAVIAGGGVRAAEGNWTKITIERFTVLTSGGEQSARRWATELVRFHRGLQRIVPVPLEKLSPVTVVLFKNDRELDDYVPLENGRPARVGGMFVRTNDVNTIMLSLTRDERETRRVIFHEAVHWHLGARGDRPPLWLAEGLAELYSTFEQPDAQHERIGAPLAGHMATLRAAKFLPLAELVAIDRRSLLFTESARENIFYAESWALTHLLFFGDGAPGSDGVGRYLALRQNGTVPELAFKTAFRADYAALEAKLRRYVPAGTYRRSIATHAADSEEPLIFSRASRAEVELAKGALLLGTRGPAAAERQLLLATELAPRDARAWELRGIATATAATSPLNASAMDTAAAQFRQAIECEPSRVSAYEGLAGVIYDMRTVGSEDRSLLARGLGLAPGNLTIETGIAGAEIRAGETAAGRARLERICRLDPAGTSEDLRYARQMLEGEQLKFDAAEIAKFAAEGRYAEVIALVDRVLARGLTPTNQQRMVELRRQMMDFKKIADVARLIAQGDNVAAKKLLAELDVSNPDTAAVEGALQRLMDREKTAPPVPR